MLTKFPSANIQLVREAFDATRAIASVVKSRAANLDALAATGNTKSADIFTFIDNLRANFAMMQAAIAGAGSANVVAYAQGELPDAAGLDTVYTAMVNAITGTVNWIVTNFPKDGSGYLLAQTIAADGTRIERVFSAPSLSGLRTVLQALIATID